MFLVLCVLVLLQLDKVFYLERWKVKEVYGMQKRLTWKVGGFLVIQVREGLYSIARMAGKTTLCVYNIFRESDHWGDVDWTRVEVLFEVFVGTVVQKNLGVRKISI